MTHNTSVVVLPHDIWSCTLPKLDEKDHISLLLVNKRFKEMIAACTSSFTTPSICMNPIAWTLLYLPNLKHLEFPLTRRGMPSFSAKDLPVGLISLVLPPDCTSLTYNQYLPKHLSKLIAINLVWDITGLNGPRVMDMVHVSNIITGIHHQNQLLFSESPVLQIKTIILTQNFRKKNISLHLIEEPAIDKRIYVDDGQFNKYSHLEFSIATLDDRCKSLFHPTLQSLTARMIYNQWPELIPCLPKNLTTLTIKSIAFDGILGDWGPQIGLLPRTLKHLNLDLLPGGCSFTSASLPHLPPLESLVLIGVLISDLDLHLLPRSLVKLRISDKCRVSTGVPTFQALTQLKELHFVFSYESDVCDVLLSTLPDSLTSLTLNYVRLNQSCETGFLNRLTQLKELRLNSGFDFESYNDFPRSVTTFDMTIMDPCIHTKALFELLPRGLKTFSMRDDGQMDQNAYLGLPDLEFFNHSSPSIRGHHYQYLPKTLKTLFLFHERGASMHTSDSSGLKDLPRGLKTLSIYTLSLEDEHVAELPPHLISLHVKKIRTISKENLKLLPYDRSCVFPGVD
jgi:hypothetical protein